VAVIGTHYVQALAFSWPAVVMSLPPGLLITAILVVNNLRDIATDRAAGKRTLAVMIGPYATRIEYALLVGLAYGVPPVACMAGDSAVPVLLPLLSLPLAGACLRLVFTASGRDLNEGLGRTAMLALVFSLLLAAGLVLSGTP
jgi:1,4-dihydroxy-2-naphthoate octaprenyltransferase